MPNVITRDEYLEISSVPLSTPAWWITDLEQLYDGPPDRGEDLIIPGAAGVSTQPRRAHAARKVLTLIVDGVKDREGNLYANPITGVRTNLDYLKTNVTAPVDTGDGTRPAVLHLKDGSTRSEDIIVRSSLEPAARGKHTLLCRLEIIIPTGSFT
jgi:hypothetical protein